MLLTGAAGLVGRYCAKILATAGYQVVAVVRNKPLDEFWSYSCVSDTWVIDLSSNNSVEQLCELNNGLPFDCVVHCAADMSAAIPNGQSQHELYRNNVDSLWNMLRFRQLCAANTFLYFSTFFVSFLEQNQQMHSVMSPYALSKMHGEWLCRMFMQCDYFRLIVLRPSFVYGFSPSQDDLISKWLRSALEDDVLHVSGDGETIRNYVYVEDVARAVQKLLETSTDGTKLMTNEEEISLNDVIAAISEVLSQKRVKREYVDIDVYGYSATGLSGARVDSDFRTIQQGIANMKCLHNKYVRDR